MWFTAHYIDEGSLLKNVPNKEEMIGLNVLSKAAYYDDNQTAIEALTVKWKQASWTTARYMMEDWENRLIKRDTFLNGQEYSFDYIDDGKVIKGTATDLDRMSANTPKLWSDYFKIMEDLTRENLDGESLGGAEDSFLEE
jgi:hypothetical protein